jgi:hypothetical protein
MRLTKILPACHSGIRTAGFLLLAQALPSLTQLNEHYETRYGSTVFGNYDWLLNELILVKPNSIPNTTRSERGYSVPLLCECAVPRKRIEARFVRLFAQFRFLSFPLPGIGSCRYLFAVLFARGNQGVEDPRHFVRRCGNRLGPSHFASHAAEEPAGFRFAALQRLRSRSQRQGGPVASFPRLRLQHLPSADVVMRA